MNSLPLLAFFLPSYSPSQFFICLCAVVAAWMQCFHAFSLVLLLTFVVALVLKLALALKLELRSRLFLTLLSVCLSVCLSLSHSLSQPPSCFCATLLQRHALSLALSLQSVLSLGFNTTIAHCTCSLLLPMLPLSLVNFDPI